MLISIAHRYMIVDERHFPHTSGPMAHGPLRKIASIYEWANGPFWLLWIRIAWFLALQEPSYSSVPKPFMPIEMCCCLCHNNVHNVMGLSFCNLWNLTGLCILKWKGTGARAGRGSHFHFFSPSYEQRNSPHHCPAMPPEGPSLGGFSFTGWRAPLSIYRTKNIRFLLSLLVYYKKKINNDLVGWFYRAERAHFG